MTQLTDNIYAVPVPDDATDFNIEILGEENWYKLQYSHQIDDEESGFYGEYEEVDIDLPPGNWQYLFTSKDCTIVYCIWQKNPFTPFYGPMGWNRRKIIMQF